MIKLKKPILEELPVIDPEKLSELQREILVDAYDNLCHSRIQTLPQIDRDEVRNQIDRALGRASGLDI